MWKWEWNVKFYVFYSELSPHNLGIKTFLWSYDKFKQLELVVAQPKIQVCKGYVKNH